MGCGYVRMGSAALDEAEHLVQSNDREMVEGVVDYLVKLGHRRIGLIEALGFPSAFERREAFLPPCIATGWKSRLPRWHRATTGSIRATVRQ